MCTRPPRVELISTAERTLKQHKKGCVQASCSQWHRTQKKHTCLHLFSAVFPSSQPMAHSVVEDRFPNPSTPTWLKLSGCSCSYENAWCNYRRSVTLDVLDLVKTPAASIPVRMKMT